jgi:cellulose synthase operon protein C
MKIILLTIAGLLATSPILAKESAIMKKEKQARSEELKSLQTRSEVSVADAAKAHKLRVKAIDSILKVLKTTSEPNRQYELLRRLGELYVEQAEFRLGREIADFEKAYAKWEKGGSKGKAPVADYKRSTGSIKSGIAVYETIIAKFPKNSAVDVSYYEVGKLLLRLDDKKGVTYLTRLAKEHPKSEFVPETYLALGEYYFDRHEILTARDYYLKAAKYSAHSIYPYTVFKLGWAYYNSPAKNPEDELQNRKLAIAAFKMVVSLSTRREATPNQIYLRQEAINDLIMVWAETEDINSAWTYFRSIDSQDSFYIMLEKLGAIYTEQGENEKAIVVFLGVF